MSGPLCFCKQAQPQTPLELNDRQKYYSQCEDCYQRSFIDKGFRPSTIPVTLDRQDTNQPCYNTHYHFKRSPVPTRLATIGNDQPIYMCKDCYEHNIDYQQLTNRNILVGNINWDE